MMPFEHTGLQTIRRLVGRDVELRHLFAVQSARERETTWLRSTWVSSFWTHRWRALIAMRLRWSVPPTEVQSRSRLGSTSMCFRPPGLAICWIGLAMFSRSRRSHNDGKGDERLVSDIETSLKSPSLSSGARTCPKASGSPDPRPSSTARCHSPRRRPPSARGMETSHTPS